MSELLLASYGTMQAFPAWLNLVATMGGYLSRRGAHTQTEVLVAMCDRRGLAQMGSQRSANSQPCQGRAAGGGEARLERHQELVKMQFG